MDSRQPWPRRWRWLAWIVGLIVFMALFYSCALPGDLPAGRDGTSRLSGTYTVNGVDPNGGEYAGTVVIEATDDPDSYHIQWLISGALQEGTGVVDGDRLDVTWTSTASAQDDPVSGSGSYTIDADGTLNGTWRIEDGTVEGTEEIFPEP